MGIDPENFDAEFVRKILRKELKSTGALLQLAGRWKDHSGVMRTSGRKHENDLRRRYAALKQLELAVDRCEAILTPSDDGPRLES